MQVIELEDTMKDVNARPGPRDPGVAADGIVRIEDALVRRELRERMFGLDAEPVSVGRYEVRGRLGAGGMGVVYAATDPDLGREVAIKLMATCSPAHADRLVREAKALASLDHPNVVTVHEIAAALEIPVGTVRTRLRRAKQLVREELQRVQRDPSLVDATLSLLPDPS